MPVTGTTTPARKLAIPYSVLNLEDSIQEEYGTTSSTTTVLCETAWATAGDFLWEMLGYSEKVGNYLKRVLPEKCGYNDDHYALSAKLVKAITWTNNTTEDNGWPAYNRAVYAVTFGAPLYDLKEDEEVTSATEYNRFVVWSKKGAASNEKIPGGAFKTVEATPQLIPETGVRTGRTVSLEAKWLDLPHVNYAGISALSNKVNEAAMTWDGVIYPIESILFESWSEQKRVNAFGKKTSDLTFQFLIRQDDRTWNKFQKSDGTFVNVTTTGTTGGTKVYPLASFENLFKLA